MAQPPAYNRDTDFARNAGSNTDHSALNAELDKASNSINDIRHNLAILQADDGRLRPNVVTYDSLSSQMVKDISADVRADVQGDLDRAEAAAVKSESEANRSSAAAEGIDQKLNIASESASSAANSAQSASDMLENIQTFTNATQAFHGLVVGEDMRLYWHKSGDGQTLRAADYGYTTVLPVDARFYLNDGSLMLDLPFTQ